MDIDEGWARTTSVPPTDAYPRRDSRLSVDHRRIGEVFLIAAFTYIFLANAWFGDDSYITFRVVWNLVHGYGAVFNPGERVQAYTHPLWMLVLTAAYSISREFFFTALIVSYGCVAATVIHVARASRSIEAGILAVAALFSSKAFVDYTSSGLEYPLSYLLLALFYVRFCRIGDEVLDPTQMRRFGVLAGLAFVNRMDSALLYAVPIAWLAFRSWRRQERPLPLVVACTVPGAIWLLFATVYYGFPLPNTYYAKVATGIPSSIIYRQGLAYVLNSIAHDPITLASIGIAAVLAWRSTVAVRLASVSTLLYVAYTVAVGGDFMSGRFFAMPFLVSVVMIGHMLGEWPYRWVLAAGLVFYNVLTPLAPVKTTSAYTAGWPWRSQNGIRDERGHQHQITNVLSYSPFRQLPDHTWMREGLSFRNGPDKVTVQGSIGFYGLMAGPKKHIVDRNALSDPLLARLPVSPRLYFEFYSGHFFRDIPDGYLESITSGTNQVTDPLVHDFYDRVHEVTSGPILSASRLRSIVFLNMGAGRRFAFRYAQRRPIALSIPAGNERFVTDAGEKDAAAGTIRSVGRSGYLQMGPGIPMKRGRYRARWLGVSGATDGALGFVDVWSGDRHVGRQEITGSDIKPDSHVIAEMSFALEEDTTSLDYRIWVNGRSTVTLERVELASLERN